MTLADAIHSLAISGCRLTAGPDGGIALEVPPGATVAREVLDALRVHRDELAPIVEPAPHGGDLAEYLAGKNVSTRAAELVLHAVETFGVRHDRITFELDEPAGPTPEFFEPGIPCLTTAETEWFKAGEGYFTLPPGTLALAIPQTWAIADADERIGIESMLESFRRHRKPPHVPVWIAGKARALEATSITFEGAVAPDGMNLIPWRPQQPEAYTP